MLIFFALIIHSINLVLLSIARYFDRMIDGLALGRNSTLISSSKIATSRDPRPSVVSPPLVDFVTFTLARLLTRAEELFSAMTR